MKTTHELSNPYRRSDGHIGAHARVAIEHFGWHHTYHFDTHGMTSDQVVTKIAQLEAHHEMKAFRLNGFRTIQGREIVRGGTTYRIVDCTIFENGLELYLDVRPRAPGFPMRRRFITIYDVPSDEATLAAITSALPDSTDDVQKAHDAFVEKVKGKRGV